MADNRPAPRSVPPRVEHDLEKWALVEIMLQGTGGTAGLNSTGGPVSRN